MTGGVVVVPTPETPGPVVFEVLSGSHAYGTSGPDSDHDWRGVYLLPNRAFLGLDRVESTWEHKKSEQVFWELGHFCRLLLKGNPNIVSMLATHDDDVIVLERPFHGLRELQPLLVSQALRRAYFGWVTKELAHLASQEHGPDGATRGNFKRLSHVPRLIWEFEEALKNGVVPVRLREDHVEVVRSIKFGLLPYEEARGLVGSMLLEMESLDARLGPGLPEPPVEAVRDWLIETRERFGRVEGAGEHGDWTGWPYGSPAKTCGRCVRPYHQANDHAADTGHWPPGTIEEEG